MQLSSTMCEAVLKAILIESPHAEQEPASDQLAAHAVALQTLLPGTPEHFSVAERTLLQEWLGRLALTHKQ